MTKYEVRPMTREDYHTLIEHTPEAPLWGMLHDKLDYLLQADSWTGLVNGQIVACGGIVRIWPGLAEAWIAVTPLARQHTTFLYRHTLAFLELVTDTYGLRRIEAHVQEDFHLAQRFAQRLGFQHECRLFKYGPNGETFVLRSKVM